MRHHTATPSAPPRTPRHRSRRRLGAGAVGALTAGLVLTAAPAQAAPSVDQELPFRCGEAWEGGTRASHSPSFWSVDFNRDNDFRAPVVASAPGHVYRVNDVGDRSYGKYVFIDHGNGESTVYAHLDKFLVQQGAYVDQGQVIGLLGNSGGSFGAHLHYEQRYGSEVGQPFFHQYPLVFRTDLESRNCPQAPLTGDWDGDGDADRAVFARGRTSAFRLKTGRTVRRIEMGSAIDQAVAGDWDGDGTDGVAVRNPRNRKVVMRNLGGTERTVTYAPQTAQLLAGDWDGDGKDSLGFYRPAYRAFLLSTPGQPRQRIRWGTEGSLPVTGDWDGDGTDDVGSFDPDTAEFSLRLLDAETGAPYEVLVPVTLADRPVAARAATADGSKPYDPDDAATDEAPAPDPTVEDSRADPAEPETARAPVVEPDTGTDPGTPTIELRAPTLSAAPLPVVGDWNGDGRSDLGVWDPATGKWTNWVVNTLERRASGPFGKRFGYKRY